ncbi:MBL fold metallo-hydrolase [Defluviitalea phaphyphila]|uniref:MBL fold metallo-hydrolase n=1 Tax=Defluviitalea phaphyphila TaxID=1473580 RepID=UPI000731D71D|nr:MBL fold metallo-hydrolase [Defluviitalea phaphyphila]
MIIKKVIVGMMAVNCYIVGDENTRKGVVIDPGAEANKIIEEIKKENLDIEYILLTHSHFDHIGAVDKVKEFTKAKVVIHKEGQEYLKNPNLNLSKSFANKEIKIDPDKLISDGEFIKFGNLTFRVFYTPGHTVDGVNYYEENNKVLFSGDNLFRNSIGRSDLPGGDQNLLITSLKNKIMTLPENVKVYPGHEAETTIGFEKNNNPYLIENSWDE